MDVQKSHVKIFKYCHDVGGERANGQINVLVQDLDSVGEKQNLDVEVDGLLVCSGNVIRKGFAWGG